jgi:hypothetical protein
LQGGTVRLQSFDPLTDSNTGGVDFAAANTKFVPCQDSDDFRLQFDSNLERMAVQIQGADGGNHVGYLEPGGGLVDVTEPKGSGYGADLPDFESPTFNPKTGMLWFADNATQRFGWFDPAAAPNGAPHFLPRRSLTGRIYFSADGHLVPRGSNGPVTPDGRSDVYYDPGAGWRSDTPPDAQHTHGFDDVLEPTGHVTAPGCSPNQFIDARTFLCLGNGTTGSPFGVYKMTIHGHTVSQLPLLPPSKTMAVQSVAVGPDHKQIAFIAVDRAVGHVYLYTALLSGEGEPSKVIQLEDSQISGPDLFVVAWK